MSAPVRIEARAWTDIRFATLARLLGLADADHALIKVARLWSWQTEHFAPHQPTYEVDGDTIESVLGAGGPAALVRAKLADETPTGYRIRGTEGQIEWCDSLSSKRQQAGRARADGVQRDARGRMLPRAGNAEHSESSTSPAPIQHITSSDPAKSSAPDPAPDPEIGEKYLTHTIPPTPVHGGEPGTRQPGPRATQQGAATPGQEATAQGAVPAAGNVAKPQTSSTPDRAGPPPNTGTFATRAEVVAAIAGPYNADDPRARGRLAEATYRRVSDALLAIAAELRLPPPLPFPTITPSSPAASLRDCQDRVREEGAAAPAVCDRVVDNLIRQAREERSVEWLAEKSFTPGGWRTARAWMPGAAARRRGPVKGDPLPPAPPPVRRREPPAVVISPEERAAVAAAAAEVDRLGAVAAVAELRDRLDAAARAPPRSAATDPARPDQQPHTKAAT